MIYFVDDIPNDMAKYCNKTEISSQEGQYFFLQKQGKRGLQMESNGDDDVSRPISSTSLSYVTQMDMFAKKIFEKKGNFSFFFLCSFFIFCSLKGKIGFFSAAVENCCARQLVGAKHHQIYQDKLFLL